MTILLVTTSQFGYLVDYHRYYSYLTKNGHTVKYISYDHGRPKMEEGNSDIIYVPKNSNKIRQLAAFINAVRKAEKTYRFDRMLIHYFLLVTSLLLFIPNHTMILDIRTVSIHTQKYKRRLFDSLIRFAAHRFRNVSILNDLSAKHLGIRRYKLLPLGGARFSAEKQEEADLVSYRHLFDDDHYIFLYVGTLNKRRMTDCVRGFHAYLAKHPAARARFIILGEGFGNEVKEINEYVTANGLQQVVYAPGFVPQSRLAVFFEHADCGVCFVPLTPYFNVQPSTKTYEYLINGIPVIATAIQDNVRLLEASRVPCGLLIGDNAEEFENAVGEMMNRAFDAEAISREFSEYEWDNLFTKYLEDLFSYEQRSLHRA